VGFGLVHHDLQVFFPLGLPDILPHTGMPPPSPHPAGASLESVNNCLAVRDDGHVCSLLQEPHGLTQGCDLRHGGSLGQRSRHSPMDRDGVPIVGLDIHPPACPATNPMPGVEPRPVCIDPPTRQVVSCCTVRKFDLKVLPTVLRLSQHVGRLASSLEQHLPWSVLTAWVRA
jgi:hypothetical protein